MNLQPQLRVSVLKASSPKLYHYYDRCSSYRRQRHRQLEARQHTNNVVSRAPSPSSHPRSQSKQYPNPTPWSCNPSISQPKAYRWRWQRTGASPTTPSSKTLIAPYITTVTISNAARQQCHTARKHFFTEWPTCASILCWQLSERCKRCEWTFKIGQLHDDGWESEWGNIG